MDAVPFRRLHLNLPFLLAVKGRAGILFVYLPGCLHPSVPEIQFSNYLSLELLKKVCVFRRNSGTNFQHWPRVIFFSSPPVLLFLYLNVLKTSGPSEYYETPTGLPAAPETFSFPVPCPFPRVISHSSTLEACSPQVFTGVPVFFGEAWPPLPRNPSSHPLRITLPHAFKCFHSARPLIVVSQNSKSTRTHLAPNLFATRTRSSLAPQCLLQAPTFFFYPSFPLESPIPRQRHSPPHRADPTPHLHRHFFPSNLPDFLRTTHTHPSKGKLCKNNPPPRPRRASIPFWSSLLIVSFCKIFFFSAWRTTLPAPPAIFPHRASSPLRLFVMPLHPKGIDPFEQEEVGGNFDNFALSK